MLVSVICGDCLLLNANFLDLEVIFHDVDDGQIFMSQNICSYLEQINILIFLKI